MSWAIPWHFSTEGGYYSTKLGVDFSKSDSFDFIAFCSGGQPTQPRTETVDTTQTQQKNKQTAVKLNYRISAHTIYALKSKKIQTQ